MMRLKARISSRFLPIRRAGLGLMYRLLVLHAGSLAATLTGAEMAPDTVGHEAAGCVTSNE